MGLSAKEAGELVGLSRAGILKAIKTGRISAAKDINGQWSVEPVELFRVYPAIHSNGHTPVSNGTQESVSQDTGGLQRENALLRETVDDLRRRLDVATEENQRLTAVLTTQLSPQQSKKVGWWQRLIGAT
jgi:hypothetical protein